MAPSPDQLKDWISRLRGMILAGAFNVEEMLLKLALADEFGTNDANTGGAPYKAREMRWRREHSVGRKIGRAKPIIRKHLGNPVADEVVRRLAEFGRIRNVFAHYPCWMEAVNDESRKRTVAMNLFIGDASHVWQVDEQQAEQWANLFHQARVDVENLVRRLIGAPPLQADGSPPPASLSA